MGLKFDLTRMLGAPRELMCEKCGKLVPTHFEQMDLRSACGNPNPFPGKWALPYFCLHCNTVSSYRFQIVRMTWPSGLKDERLEPAEPDRNPEGTMCGLCDANYAHEHPRLRCKICGAAGLAENMPSHRCKLPHEQKTETG